MLYNSTVRHLVLLSLLTSLTIATSIVGCDADVGESCVAGPCGQTPPPDGEGGAGAAGAAGGAGGVGGGGGAGGGVIDCSGTPATGDLPCAVYDVLKAKCQTCHTVPAQNGAPFPLLTYEDTRGDYGGKQRWERMGPAITSGFMPFGAAPDLTADEKQTLLDWLGACGAPEAEGAGCGCDDPAACP